MLLLSIFLLRFLSLSSIGIVIEGEYARGNKINKVIIVHYLYNYSTYNAEYEISHNKLKCYYC